MRSAVHRLLESSGGVGEIWYNIQSSRMCRHDLGTLELSRDDYEQMIQGYIDETMEAVHTALDDVNLTTQDIDEVLLVGGSTRTPLESLLNGLMP